MKMSLYPCSVSHSLPILLLQSRSTLFNIGWYHNPPIPLQQRNTLTLTCLYLFISPLKQPFNSQNKPKHQEGHSHDLKIIEFKVNYMIR